MQRVEPKDRTPLLLHRRSRSSSWMAILWRVLLVLALIGVALAGHWFGRSGLRDNIDGGISFADVIYFTMITITTVGYGDIVPVTDGARMFDTFVVTPIRLFVWLIFLGTAYDFLLKRVWDRWRMVMIQRQLSDHVIVAGYGSSGAEATAELIRRGADPACIVVIDGRDAAIDAAKQTGVNVLQGDATRDLTLEAVHVGLARSVIVAAGRDDTSILIVLTVRGLAPHVPISVVIRSEDNEQLARQAGATTVINPVSFAGILLAGSTHGEHVADYIADLAAHGGRVALHERAVADAEVGQPLSAVRSGLGVRIHRGERTIGFWEPEAQSLAAGDLILEIRPL